MGSVAQTPPAACMTHDSETGRYVLILPMPSANASASRNSSHFVLISKTASRCPDPDLLASSRSGCTISLQYLHTALSVSAFSGLPSSRTTSVVASLCHCAGIEPNLVCESLSMIRLGYAVGIGGSAVVAALTAAVACHMTMGNPKRGVTFDKTPLKTMGCRRGMSTASKRKELCPCSPLAVQTLTP